MKSLCLFAALIAFVGLATAQNTAPATTNPELARQFERTAAAFKAVIKDAQASNRVGLQKSLENATTTWRDTYKKYRHWATADVNWQSDFDAIHATLINATNALSPGNNLPQVAQYMQTALTQLQGLQDRNGVPDLEGNIQDVQDSLAKISTNVKALRGQPPTIADLQTYAETFQEMQTVWKRFVQGIIDFNALGLGDGTLQAMQKRVDTQNQIFTAIIGSINSPNTQQLIASLQQAQDALASLKEQIDGLAPQTEVDAPTEDATAKGLTPVQPQPQPQPRRPLFPLLGR